MGHKKNRLTLNNKNLIYIGFMVVKGVKVKINVKKKQRKLSQKVLIYKFSFVKSYISY